MKTVAIIQARMTSSRLPGKMMMDLGGKPVLQHVIERVRMIKAVDLVVCAFPDHKASKPMIDLTDMMQVETFVGSETDVLDRYYEAADLSGADIIVRVTGDCPMFDPTIAAMVIKLREIKGVNYASNCHPRSFPKGLDIECFTHAALAEAHSYATDDYDREHVTPYIVRHNKGATLASGVPKHQLRRWTLDTRADLEFMRNVFINGNPILMEDTMRLIDECAINDKEAA